MHFYYSKLHSIELRAELIEIYKTTKTNVDCWWGQNDIYLNYNKNKLTEKLKSVWLYDLKKLGKLQYLATS